MIMAACVCVLSEMPPLSHGHPLLSHCPHLTVLSSAATMSRKQMDQFTYAIGLKKWCVYEAAFDQGLFTLALSL